LVSFSAFFSGNASLYFNLATGFPNCNIPENWRGTLEVSGSVDLVGTVMEVHDGWNRVSAYQAIKNGGSTNIAIPSALCRTYGQSSYLGIANPADSAVSFKVQFQPLSGPVTIRSHLVRAHGRIGLSTCQQIGNTPWFGSASISETTGLLSVISKVTRDDGNPDAEGSVEGISVEEAGDETQ
jgi:hypothetical protein